MLVMGIVIGIDVAEKNIQRIQGVEGAPRAIQVTPVNGKVEIAVLGQVIQTTNPIEKINGKKVGQVTKVVQEQGSLVARVSNEVGDGIRRTTRDLLETFFSLFD
jgi:hypothetical protein